MVGMDKISFSEDLGVFSRGMSLMLGEEANTPLMLVKEVFIVGFQYVNSRKDNLQTLVNYDVFGKYKEHV
jgi:hypothetical protein